MLRYSALSVIGFIALTSLPTFVSAAPTSVADARQVMQGSTVIIDVLSNDQGDGVLQIVGFTQPRGGVVTTNPGGGLQLSLASDFFGSLSFTYEVVDDSGEASQALVSVTVVRGTNDRFAVQDAVSVSALVATQTQLLRSHSNAVSQWLKLSSTNRDGGSAGEGIIPLGGVFASIHRQSLDSALLQGHNSQSTDIQGVTLGADWNFGEHWVLGAGVGMNSTDAQMSDAEQTTDEASLLLFGQYHHGPWLAEGQLGFSQSDIEQTGASAFTTSGDSQFALLKTEYRIAGDAWQVMPGLSFANNTSQVDGFSQYVGTRHMTYSNHEQRHFNASISLYGDYAVSTSWGVVLPQFSIASHYCVDSDDADQGLQVNGEIFALDRKEDAQHITLDAGVAFWLTHGVSGFVNYHRVERNALLDLQGVNLGVRWEF